jgi:seryl-tRNA synthetase
VREGVRRRGGDAPVDRILELDERRRSTITEADVLRARRNEVSRELGQMRERPQELIDEMRGVGDQIRTFEEAIRNIDEEINTLLLSIPNIPRDDVPLGEDESSNIVVRTEGEIPSYDFEPLAHWDLMEKLDIVDFQRGVKIAGSRFFVLKNKGAKLQRALINWMIDVHTLEHGYEDLYLPAMANSASATGSSHLPHFADTMYHDDEDDFWLLPTAEMAITNLYRDELLQPGVIPAKFVAHTPCFRRERAAAGRDTRGIKRVHQFEKVEMYKFVEPDKSDDELVSLVADAEDICKRLGIPYRLLQLCTADIAFQSVKSFDLEMWAPGSQEWLEVSSCSNCTDFQARRASIRYRPQEGARPQFVHTLNGSGLALPRVIISILENYQQADGSVIIPEVLSPYTGFDRIG